MKKYQNILYVKAIVEKDGSIMPFEAEKLPLRPGEKIELIIVKRGHKGKKKYPLRGKTVDYFNPFESVAENDWEAMK